MLLSMPWQIHCNMASITVSTPEVVDLCPTQEQAFTSLLDLIPKSPIVALVSAGSYGRTTVLKKLAHQLSAQYLNLGDLFDDIKKVDPLQLEEAVLECFERSFASHDCVIFDDYYQIQEQLVDNCQNTARPSILGFVLSSLLQQMEKSNKTLILGMDYDWIQKPFRSKCLKVELSSFTPLDIAHLFHRMCPLSLEAVDFQTIHRFAPRLNTHQIWRASLQLRKAYTRNTSSFVKFLENHALTSNVNQEEVAQVSLDDLYGIEEVRRQLEINLIVPMERDDLVEEYKISPKRGVLLYGPPGTGKTTIGRALAHRLGSKFFLLDGTVISGTQQFYYEIRRIFAQAKDNAPSILFIDDCDLLFENASETGLYRYLLTILDGLESKSNEQVTIMLTAMNIGSLPPALIRSGRVELWLETKLPDLSARTRIVKAQLSGLKLTLDDDEVESFAAQAEGLTGSDLKRVMTDARNLHAYHLAKELPLERPIHYYEKALQQLLDHRRQLAEAPAFTAAHRPGRRE